MLVRRNKVRTALTWLKLNSVEYEELEISEENLNSYAENGIPVVVDFRRDKRDDSTEQEIDETAEEEHGTAAGPCSYAVHGLTGIEYDTADMETIKSVALQHLTDKGRMLGIGRSEAPVSMYDNVTSYPGMFPWLFPYGLGGVGHPSHARKMSE